MRFLPLTVAGAFRVEAVPQVDDRGYFVTLFETDAFERQGLCTHWVQEAQSLNLRRGTLRGLHWQEAPESEAKLVRCLRGSVFDVVVDLRSESPTYLAWEGAVLNGESLSGLYIPAGCAHGFQVMEDDSEVHYLLSGRYQSHLQRGLRWNDPALGINWPLPHQAILSARDASLPTLVCTLRRDP